MVYIDKKMLKRNSGCLCILVLLIFAILHSTMHPSSSSCSAITITSPVCPSAGATSFLFSTGLSKFGQLGINITDTPLIPQLADAISYNVKKVSVGLKHALFLTDTQKIIGVGDNTFGQLADTTNSGFPPLLSSLFSSKNTLLLATTNLGSVIYTADNLLLSVGFGSARGVVNTIQNVWKTLLAPLTPLTAISAGSNHVLLLSSLGSVYGVGDNTYGQIGSGNLLDFLVPAPLSSLLSTLLGLGEKIVSVVAGGNSSFMISSAGKLLAFGSNTFGQLCDGTTTSRGNSVAINVQGKSVKYVSGSESHTLIVTSDNTIYACGKGTDGQLGNGFFSDSKNPVVVNNALFNGKAIKKVVAAELFSLVLTEDNKLYSFGANTFGQLGDGTLLSKANPVEVNLKKLGGASICDVSAKIDMVMVVTCDGKVYTFGDSTGGKNAITSKIVSNTFDKSIKFASASDHVIYTGNDGKLYGYGRNDKGQLGDGSTLNRDLPVEISSMNGINITQIATGDSHTLILTSEGIVYSFGNNNVGQLGLGSTSSVNLPTQINMAALDTPIVTQIAAGSFHSLVLTSTGKLYSFGKNDKGQLGTGDLQDKTNPHPVDLSQLGGRTIISIYAGDTHSSFLTSDGTVFMFGPASGGQLCITGSSIVNIPQPISLNTNISQVALGTHTLLLSNDSVVYGCGSNENGELGVLSGNIKVQIPIPGNPVKIYASRGSTSFVKTSTGAVYGFGKNNFGQLGNGNYSNLFVPNLISTGISEVVAGLQHSMLISCEHPKCFGISGNESNVCSGHGSCILTDLCLCKLGYTGSDCSIKTCFGLPALDNLVCGGNGSCSSIDSCLCNNGFFGLDCTIIKCLGIFSNRSDVCSGHGSCSLLGCQCNEGYTNNDCSVPKCFDIRADSHSTVCSGNGQCLAPDLCNCTDGYSGLNCSTPSCFGLQPNETNVCSGRGSCVGLNTCSCLNGYFGANCSISSCFGILSNQSNVCSGNGYCSNMDNCVCNSGYFGSNCSIPSCYGNLSNETNVCSGHGQCLTLDNCLCNSGYYGANCSISSCYGNLSNETNVCGGKGKCSEKDTCICDNGYTGFNCSVPTCFDVLGNTTEVCNGNGVCSEFNKCICKDGYMGLNCSIPTCFGIPANDSSVCGGNGKCVGLDNCVCNTGHYNATCLIPICFGILSNNSNVCFGNGVCADYNNCSCFNGWISSNCSLPVCFGYSILNSSLLCSGNGQCVSPNVCSCSSGYFGLNCSIPSCFGILGNESNVCSGNGQCLSLDKCLCNQGYYGANCSIPSCFGIPANNSNVCSGNGVCTGLNLCSCNSTWYGSNCSIPICFGLTNLNSSVCSGNGNCFSPNNCSCGTGYTGSSCNMPICFGLTNNDQQVCSGKGICNAPNVCQCQMYYYGPICNVTQCYGTFSNDSSVCSGNGVCTGYNNCVCSGILFVAVDCSNTATTCYGKNSNDASVCSGKGVCSSNNNCTCNDGYLGSECQYQKIDTAFINFISDSFIGIENYTSFSIQIGLNNVPKYSKSFIYKYRINDLFNSITFDNNITFIMPNKGIYTLAVEIQVDDIIVGKATKTITVIDIQYALNNLDQLSLKAIMKIASDDNNFKENKSSLLKSLISTLQGKTINNVDDGTQLLTAYESLTKYTDELSSLTLNITNKMNEYCSFILDAKKNNLLTDEKASDSVSGVSNVLNNILAVNSTSDTHSTLLTSTESIVQTSLSLLSLSTSIQEKKIENKNIKILFYRPKNNLDNLNITVNGNYGFDIPSDILSQNNNNIAFGAVHYDVDNLFILPNSSSVLFNPSNHNTTSNVTVIATKISQFTTFINGNYVPLTNLTNPLTMTFEEFENVMDIDLKYFDVNTTYQCKYFDEKSQQWKGDGCYFVKSTFVNDKKILTCACTHTTSFTVFLEISTNLNTAMLQAQRRMSIAQIIISGIFIIFIGVIFISLLIQRKDNLIKSRYVTPHIGLISLLLKCIFVGIVANAVFTQSTEGDLFSVKITQSIKDANIISNAFVIVTCALTIIAITTYLLQNLRYLIVKYMYELIANNPKYQNKLLKSLSSFKVYITISITLFIATALYYILFVLLKNFSIISQDIFVYIISISYFTTILFISFLLFIIFIFDAYLSVKYKQYTNEFYDIINTTQTFSNSNENNVKSTNNNNNGKKGRRIYGVKHFYRDIYNYFIVNDTLLFRLELIIFFIGLIFFVASFIIGFLSIPTRFNSNTDNNNNNPSTSTVNMIDIYNTVILATETVNVFCWILIFGGFTSFVAFIRFIKRKRNQKKKNKGINNPSQSVSSLNNNSNNSNSSTIVLDQQQQQQEEEESCEIEEILKNKHYYYLFKQYCKQEFSLENLYAFVEYHRFKNETNELKLLSQLKSFRDTYLVEGPMELNLPSKSKRLFLDFVTLLIEKNGRLEGIEKEWKNLLADVEYAILQNLGDTFSRFMLTEEFERLQKSMELTQQFEQHFDL